MTITRFSILVPLHICRLASRSLLPAFMLSVVIASSAIADDKAKEPQAATLDAKAARNLISDRTWAMKKSSASGYYYWSWKADGSVCFRIEDKNASCVDTGRWKLEGDRMCYEVTWWGKSEGWASNCFRVLDKGQGHYEALQDNGMALFGFLLAE